MNYKTAQQIRETWLNFFKERGHVVEPGASLIPHDDPTLLWINSGVAALKKYFDGSVVPPCKRITNVQKSIRTNDIENVGKTARHHTFFEMLGNFSIGDYFRNEIIPWAYEILTSEKYFGLPKENVYATYNPIDLESKKLWIKAGMSEDHLIPLEGNYWQIGEGPCGPNTEVFYDRGPKYDPENIGIKLLKEDMENDRYVELWGIVFSQYNAENGLQRSEYKELPSKNIDTGAGLERITCIIQETETNFETDLFMPIIKETEILSNKKYADNKMAFRVIADHVRSCVFALADGEFFSNEGRGYVLRRLLRRAMRYGMKLGIDEPFLYKLVDTVIEVMKGYYPYLIEKKAYLEKLIKNEEEKFVKTLHTGENLLESIINKENNISGEDVFKLYDTYGFPVELTSEICEERGIKVDMDLFHKLMEEQKERARASRGDLESMNKQSIDLMNFAEKSSFTYENLVTTSKVIGLFKNGEKVDVIKDEGYVIFDTTPFYAEMGGQTADTGRGYNENCKFNVDNVVVAPQKQNLHFITILTGDVHVGDEFVLEVDKANRIQIEGNHSATHLLHSALEKVLGAKIEQKGSYVSSRYLRFDFSYLDKITAEQLNEIERTVNELINEGIEEKTLILSVYEAIKTGAKHEFGDKYGDVVRVVTFGNESKEFCGGTHVKNSKDIGTFIIRSEESVAAGTRRIEAVTGKAAYEEIKHEQNEVKALLSLLQAKGIQEGKDKTKVLLQLNESLKGDNDKLLTKLAVNKALILIKESEEKQFGKFVFSYISDANRDLLTKISDEIKNKISNAVIVLVGEKTNETYPLVVSISKSVKIKLPAGAIIKEITKILGGSGGGRPDYACGAIKDVSNFYEIMHNIEGKL